MLLVVSGASGVGKSTARRAIAQHLGDRFETTEQSLLGPAPDPPEKAWTRAWRQEMVERAAAWAVELDRDGRHLVLAGDPVPAGEALAAPSAEDLDVAILLLDAAPAAQTARLRERADANLDALLPSHLAFAAWMRRHATDPSHLPHVVTEDAWPPMVWDRWVGRDVVAAWAMSVLDTTELTPQAVGQEVVAWCRDAVDGRAPVFRAGWHRGGS